MRGGGRIPDGYRLGVTLHLIVGLPGAGKTVRARELAAAQGALRLTPDEWQQAIFAADGPSGWRSAERAAHRVRLEGKLIEAGLRAASLGVEVVLDFGFWSRDERSALRWAAAELGVPSRVVYLPVEYEEQRRRVARRRAEDPQQFAMSDEELRSWHLQFEAPDTDELRGDRIPEAPAGHADWWEWAVRRWPALPDKLPH